MVAINSGPLGRLKRGIVQYGLIPFVKQRISKTFNRIFRARLCVWVWKHGERLADVSKDVKIVQYRSADELPGEVHRALVAGDSDTFTSRMREEFAEGGILWVGFLGTRVAGYQWSRTGNFVEKWHFELNDRDVLIYSTVTFHDFRGRGVAASIMSQICRDEVGPDGRACADCMVWNTPAVRFIKKTGFTMVAERKPLPDHPD